MTLTRQGQEQFGQPPRQLFDTVDHRPALAKMRLT